MRYGILITTIAITALATGCAAAGQEAPVREAETTLPIAMVDLMEKASCEGSVVEPQLYTLEVGVCDVPSGEVTAATFARPEDAELWTSTGAAFGMQVATSPDGTWAIGAVGREPIDEFLDAYNS